MLQRWSKHMTQALRAHIRRGALLTLASLIAVLMVLTPIMTRPAQAQGLSDLAALGGSFTNGLSSCAIETVGWVICPTMRSIAKLADYGFTYMNQNFLRIDYALAANDSGTYTAWEIMRTIANAAFVVAFMVLVYSQISGRGSGGYSIKRLLPRLIIAAIAVNISYFLCVFMIDISNIIGDSVLNILKGVAERIGPTIMPIGEQASAFQDGTLTTITASVMQKTGIAWVLLTPVAAVIISVATICAAILILLIMRKTIIALLILISPLLFVAYLLPNLERFFTQGLRLFIQLLVLYPIIALLLGAGQIVSATIVSVGSNDADYRVSGDSYFSRNGGSGSAITDLTAAAAAALPLLGVWFLFKNMSSLMNMAGSRLTAAVKGRRGDGTDKEARVTGKATAGAQNIKKMFGGEGANRRQAYSRNRRRRSLGGSTLAGEGEGAKLRTNQQEAGPAAMQGVFGGAGLQNQQSQDDKTRRDQEEARRQQEQQEALSQGANPDELDLDNLDVNTRNAADTDQKMSIEGGSKDDKDDGHASAKELFSQMNRQQGHQSKDKERKFSAGPPAGNSGGASGGSEAGGSGQPTGPTTSYRAPQIAQNENIISGSSTPAQPTKVIAVPVRVDESSLLGQNKPPTSGDMTQPPVSGTQEKAKARAQKYLFDAEQDLESARDEQDSDRHDKHNDAFPDISLRDAYKQKDKGDE
tara:strand:+ start:2626 stop:4722 length:2097 start_codon:yes stop_codon:yes gene_type:complete